MSALPGPRAEAVAPPLPRHEESAIAEAVRLVSLAQERGVALRLLGGIAVRVRCPAWRPRQDRVRDIDLATRAADRRDVSAFLADQGYRPDKHYNALYGRKQLYFYDDARERALDVLVDRLEMCHVLPFADRLVVDPATLPLADLALSKLQIVEINRKDLVDLGVLFSSHPLGDGDGLAINVRRVVDITAGDWGWWRTVSRNLERLQEFLVDDVAAEELDFGRPADHDAAAQVRALRDRIETAPKSRSWKTRALLGERVRWYELPEEAEHRDT